MKTHLSRQIVLILFLISGMAFLFSCKKDKPIVTKNEFIQLPGQKVLICNEGNFGSGNSSLSIYNIDYNSMQKDVFRTVNNKGLGDVLQASALWNDQIFLSINNSQKISIIDKNSIQEMKEVAIRFPRNILKGNGNDMWVSSLYSNYIYVMDVGSHTLKDSVFFPYKNTEGIFRINDALYVAIWDTACSHLYKIDLNSYEIIKSINLGAKAPHSMILDKEQNLWVFSGNVIKNTPNAITKIDISTDNIIQQFEIPFTDVEIIKPTINPTGDKIYWLGVNYTSDFKNGVFCMDIKDDSLPENPIIKANYLQYFWGLNVDQERIFVSDPKGFIQEGELMIYNLEGEFIKSIPSGFGTGNLFFYE